MAFSELKKSFELGFRRFLRPHDNLRERNLDDFVALGVSWRRFQPLRTHKKRLRNDLAHSIVNMKIKQCIFDETNNTLRLTV